jgi:hypothetical protein
MLGARIAALLAVILLGIVAMVWPFGWPRSPQARSQLSYAASVVLGIGALLLVPLGHGPAVPFFATIALIAWLGIGVLWLIRRNPQIQNPEWTRRPWSVADWGLIAILLLAGLATVFG